MVSANDPVESFFNSLEVVKGVFSPLESGIRKAAKDFEQCWPDKNGDKIRFEAIKAQSNGGVKAQSCSLKKKNGSSFVVSDDKRKGTPFKVPVKTFFGIFLPNCGNDKQENDSKNDKPSKGSKEEISKGDVSCSNCLQFAVTWSLLFNGFVQALPIPFKNSKKRFQKLGDEDKSCTYSGVQLSKQTALGEIKRKRSNGRCVVMFQNNDREDRKVNELSIECFIGFLCDQVTQNLQKIDFAIQESKCKSDNSPQNPPSTNGNHFNALASIFEATKAHGNGFLGNLKFARVGGVPSTVVGEDSVEENGDDGVINKNENDGNSPQKMANGILSIPLSNVERLRSTLSTVSFAELIELVPNLVRSSKEEEHPDKKKLFSVQDFFRYTEAEGRRFFEELDRDGDGQVTMDDLEMAMRKRKLPQKYANEFMSRTKSHLFSKSFGWKQFLTLMEQKEPTILRAYTTLCLSKSGTLQKSEVLASLKNAGLPANEDHAVAMMRFLNADSEESISYGHFRNFMLLLPSDRLQEDPRSIWFEAATVVAVPPPVELPASSVLKAALVGGLSCALSCSLLHPVDTIKTRVQASSTLTFPEILAKLPEIGVRGLYRGSLPAIFGQFSSHGLRTGIFEASKLVLVKVAPDVPEIQIQSVASFCSTFLGTAVRIPCEVLKQRLQAGLFDNVGEAIVGTWHQDGLKGFFRGTGAILLREVPFYVAGMGLFAESKKAVQHLLGRELEPWETIAVGALSGGLTAVVTTPFDVMKTRMMTAPGGRSLPMQLVAISVLRREGPLGLFKGAVPRFFWVAPLGAMNFAGYELAKKAMEKNKETATE